MVVKNRFGDGLKDAKTSVALVKKIQVENNSAQRGKLSALLSREGECSNYLLIGAYKSYIQSKFKPQAQARNSGGKLKRTGSVGKTMKGRAGKFTAQKWAQKQLAEKKSAAKKVIKQQLAKGSAKARKLSESELAARAKLMNEMHGTLLQNAPYVAGSAGWAYELSFLTSYTVARVKGIVRVRRAKSQEKAATPELLSPSANSELEQ